nr:AAA family ATPase [Candidatus Sigynarchaeota archaeon]
MTKIQERVSKLLDKLNEGLLERELPLKLSFLATIAGECFFMLGPPGVAKSLIARRLTKAFKDAKLFMYLMNRFSTPDEVFGPYSIHELKDNDRLLRKTEGYLPDANITFLDEIWKASPSIQNTLLTIINEKIFRNGIDERKVPLYGILAASNELPEKNQGLEALWDRFLVRSLILGIEDRVKFESMITSVSDVMNPVIDDGLLISLEDLNKWQGQISKVVIPREVLDVVHFIRNQLRDLNEKVEDEEDKIIVSDRRWKKIMNFLRACAFLNGREKVDLMDCFLIAHCVWNEPDQIEQVSTIIRDGIRNHGYKKVIDAASIERAIDVLDKEVDTETHFVKKTTIKELAVHGDSYIIENFSIQFPYIKVNDWNNIGNNTNANMQFYNKRGERYNSYCGSNTIMKKSKKKLQYDGQEYNLQEIERIDEKIETKQPHQAVIDAWNKTVDDIKERITKEKNNLQSYVDVDLKHVKANLFVPQEHSTVVLNKVEELKNALNQLEVRLLKIKDTYTNIK